MVCVKNKKNETKVIKFYLAIRSQPDADVEDLVVVEEGEGERAVHSTMDAVSHQKASILANWNRKESESVHKSPFTFFDHLFSSFPVHWFIPGLPRHLKKVNYIEKPLCSLSNL